MAFNEKNFKYSEKAVFDLRNLYQKYGYIHYKVSKFEEYDLYMRNKNFLLSENVLTFTDTNGKLMALKPDVTLSIIKNSKDADKNLQKVYYDESVYRPTDFNGFREITQTGLECIGEIDMYSMCEVIMLAIKSLALISNNYLLDISHIGFVSGVLDEAKVDEDVKSQIVNLMGQKNTALLKKICESNGVPSKICNILCTLTSLYLPFSEALEAMSGMILNQKMLDSYNELCEISYVLSAYNVCENVRVDFSVVNDMNYYNGIIFGGFVNNIPKSILSGGRYDNLLRKMGKNKGAIGFAVYLDLLEQIEKDVDRYDADCLLLYDDTAKPCDVVKAVSDLCKKYDSVKADNKENPSVKYRTKYILSGTEVTKV